MMNSLGKRFVEGKMLKQAPRRSGCMGCILAWPDGALAHLRDGKTCSSIIGGREGVGAHPYTLHGADCRHSIWIEEGQAEVPPKLMSERERKAAEVSIGLRATTPAHREIGGGWRELARLPVESTAPPLATLYATGGPGPQEPWRPTLYRDTHQEKEDSMQMAIARSKARQMSMGSKRLKVSGSQQDPAQTVVVVIGRQKFLDDI